jgi:hypothetical protein
VAKRSSISVVAALCALALAGPAQADGLLSDALPGLLSPSDEPAACDTSTSQPFSRWGDKSFYVLAPGGAFEPGEQAWKLTGRARIVDGNEPFYVRSTKDRHSLYLPARSSATSPPMCFAFGDWNFRFFSAGSGTLRIKIVVKSLLGTVSVLDGGTVSSGSEWRPSPKVALLLTNITGLLATDSVSIRLAPAGSASIRVDDVYLDPWKIT